MARPRKGVVPPQLRKYLFRKRSRSTGARRGVAHMARKRRYGVRVRAAYRKVRRRTSKFFAARGAPASLMEIGFSFGYGYARGYILNNSISQKAISMLPVGGQYKDNIFLGLAAYLVGWLLKPQGYVKQFLGTMIKCEAFIAGAKMQSGATLTASTSSSYAGVLLN